MALTLADIDFDNNGIKIRRKGGYEVVIYFGEEVREALEIIINYGIKKKKQESYLRLNQKEYSYLINQKDITYIESKNRKLFVYTINEIIELSTYTLYKLLDELDETFKQCHKSYIINTDYVEKIDKSESFVKLRDVESNIPIGRKYKDCFRGKIYGSS